ncbi:MAG TPA: M90 family metallopeptidase [Puia sp.]|nr:M90 family metallopeptidase [Puia sp.]
MIPVFILILLVVVVAAFVRYKKPLRKTPLPEEYKKLLAEHVVFYRSLEESGKARFEEKIKEFLGYIRIEGVNTSVADLDRVLIASSAVIPIFGFPEWRYYNLRNILLYADAFNENTYSTIGEGRDVSGMVGNGAMQMQMILSKPALYRGFENVSGNENTGIHEFVHLLDKEDGAIDGLPENLLKNQFVIPWLNLMAENIAAIRAGQSDINIYGATNKAEFFAVASEYFFKQPHMFKYKHPELYNLMTQIFHQNP